MDNKVMPKVFLWMFIGLLVTFITGYIVSINKNMLQSVFSTSGYIIFVIVELILVIVLSARIAKMSPTTCRIMFLLYSFISGLTFSSIFIVYKMDDIISVFFIAALIFGVFALLGSVAKIDLTKIGTFCMMGLFAVIICAIVNMFVGSSTFALGISIAALLIFLGITAYDVQKIKKNLRNIPEENLAVYGAFELYLDYINIFIRLLSLFGRDN